MSESTPSSKSQIKKLGKSIRDRQRKGLEINEELLLDLQRYRTTFQQDISEVFNHLAEISKKIRKDRVVTFRIKRIESILSKIQRQQSMQLDNMGDIAGCRCIVPTDASVLKIVEALEKKLKVRGRKDYLTTPKADGYKAYHLYVESPIDPSKLIEIQLRSHESHNWATLVEMIDVLYDKKIKEGQKEPALKEFLLLMSQKSTLTYEQRDKIMDVEKSYNIYLNLSSLFSKNHLIIRRAWFALEPKAKNTYFVISVDKNKTPTITSYNDYGQAEEVYFNIFSSNKENNVVLTHLDEVNFRKLCIAYSNYILIKHSFLDDWQGIMFNQIEADYSNRNRKKANIIVERFREIIKEEKAQTQIEIGAFAEIMESRTSEEALAGKSKLYEWLNEFENKIEAGRRTSEKLDKIVYRNESSGHKPIFRNH